MKVITIKVNEAIGLPQKFQKKLPRLILMTIYKTSLRPHLDYGDVIYDEGYKKYFTRILNSFDRMLV